MRIPKTLAGVKVNRFPVKEFVDVIKFIVGAGNVVYDTTAPDSPGGSAITLTEYPKFLSLVFKLKDAIVGIGLVPQELTDTITPEEREEIVAEILKLKYVDGDLQAQDLIDDVIKVLTELQNFMLKWVFKKTA